MNYQIITDTGCDFPMDMYAKLGLTVVPLTVTYKAQDYTLYSEQFLEQMFAGLRAGEQAKTSAINPNGWSKAMRQHLQQGQDVLVLTFSSGLSTTYQSAVIAAQELQEEFPDRQIRVVDTLAASLGQGLLVHYACQKRDAGMPLNLLAAWVEETRYKLCHWFTVADLMYLKRGGRVSTATALMGTMLQIKPVLHVDNEGHLINKSKVRGRKASIEALAKKMGELAIPNANDTVFICHGDCLEDAQTLEAMVREKYGVKHVFIYYVGAVIGSHSGPGTLALFFLGKQR